MVTYEKIRNGSLDINKGITYVASNDYEGGTGVLQGQVNTTLAKLNQIILPLGCLIEY